MSELPASPPRTPVWLIGQQVRQTMHPFRQHLFPSAVCLFFLLSGIRLIPYAGIQNDEALFSVPIFQNWQEFAVRVGDRTIPLMLMSYLGTLKTFVYWPIFAVFGVSPYAIRLPTVILGALTLLALLALAKRVAGPRAAAIAILLLATDPTFLLTNTFDWGPVALEHLLLVSGCLCFVRDAQQQERSPFQMAIFLGALCFGLAVWNKALFLWALAGLSIGTVVVLPKELLQQVRPRAVILAAVALLLGAVPFLIYNARQPNATLGRNASLEIPKWSEKLEPLRTALDGSALFGYLVADESTELETDARTMESVSPSLVRYLTHPRNSGMAFACIACLMLVPVWWRSRAARFSLVVVLVSWLLMAVTKGAGTFVHHAVLLWPFPHLFVAATFAELRWRPLVAIAVAVLVAMNLLVINQYVLQFKRDGASRYFTDALNSLSDALAAHPSENIYVADWGIQNSVALLHQGRLHLQLIDGPLRTDSPTDLEQRQVASAFSDAKGIFVGWVQGQEALPGTRERLDRMAASIGLQRDLVQLVHDSHGRARFEIFRLADRGHK